MIDKLVILILFFLYIKLFIKKYILLKFFLIIKITKLHNNILNYITLSDIILKS